MAASIRHVLRSLIATVPSGLPRLADLAPALREGARLLDGRPEPQVVEVVPPADAARLRSLARAVHAIGVEAIALEQEHSRLLAKVHAEHRAGARNLVHYLALRRCDRSELQGELVRRGLSPLNGGEGSVLQALDIIASNLARLAGDVPHTQGSDWPTTFDSAQSRLSAHADDLLGPPPSARAGRVMVTVASDATEAHIAALLNAGASALRVNCAQGDQESWLQLSQRIRRIAAERAQRCTLLFDLAGPNPRVSSLADKREQKRLKPGAHFVLAADLVTGRALATAREPVVGCTLPEVIADLRVGQRVYYDDGNLAGVIVAQRGAAVRIRVDRARKDGLRLKPNKGLNFPDSTLRLPSLTPKDVADLRFVAEHADVCSMSFIRSSDDVNALYEQLDRCRAEQLGVVLKIETRSALAELPRVLLAAMQRRRIGVLVARGDLALEVGFLKLVESQEAILALGRAALLPTILATQVLEQMGKTGVPARAELSDATLAGRAQCVLLNRGAHVASSVRFLRELLERPECTQGDRRERLGALPLGS